MAATTVRQVPPVLMYRVHFSVLVELGTLEMVYNATVGLQNNS